MTAVGAINPLYNKLSFGHKAEDKNDKDTSTTGKPYGVQSIALRDDLPISERRELSSAEQKQVEEGLSNWIPKISPGYNTKPTELLASPEKVGFLSALGLGGIASVLTGTMLTLKDGFAGADPLITGAVALFTGTIGFIGGFFSQRNSNENTLDMIKRLPEGSTMRDMLSDPLYRQQQQPTRYYGSSNGWGSMLNSFLLANVLARSSDRRD